MTDRILKINELVKQLSAAFIERETNHTSLITVTRAETSRDLKNSTIFITVFPDDRELEALNFLKRLRKDIRGFLKKKMSTKVIPFIDIDIDRGEKHRQHIEEISSEIKKEEE